MEPTKLTNMLSIISEKLSQGQIPFCLIGAMAFGIYGLPRYTSDIALLTTDDNWQNILSVMEQLGYTCYQKTDAFAQFDSESDVYGKVDFMLAKTQDGKEIIKRSITIQRDDLFDKIPVVQPTDYIILKLLAIANNPERSLRDESDISELIKLYNNNLITEKFTPLDKARILLFADKFGQQKLIEKYFAGSEPSLDGEFKL